MWSQGDKLVCWFILCHYDCFNLSTTPPIFVVVENLLVMHFAHDYHQLSWSTQWSTLYKSHFLVHLSLSLKCTVVITRCPSSVVNFSHFRLLLWNRWTEFGVTWQEARDQRPLFRADRKNKMAALASDLLRYFLLLLWNRWMEFNETWQETRSQRLLPSLCFSGRSEN